MTKKRPSRTKTRPSRTKKRPSRTKTRPSRTKRNIPESEDYVCAIPSYGRWTEITAKTLPCLKKGKVPREKIYVFVATKKEEKLYRDTLDPATYGKIIIGKKGLVQQRKYISQYFPENTHIVSMDDDVQNVVRLKKDKLMKITNLDTFFRKSFRQLQAADLYLWGVYPCKNNMFMKNNVTTDLRFAIGVIHGYINRHDPSLYPSLKSVSKEDYEQTILFFIKDKGVMRFNDIAFTTVFNAPGGLGTDRYQMNKSAQEYLCKKYPMIVKPKFRKDGTPEVTLNRNPEL
jgi:hypothetical protein